MKLLIILFVLHGSLVWGQISSFKKFKALSSPEKCWVVFHPFVAKKAMSISEMARAETELITKEQILEGSGNSGQVDAFRHALWMAYLTKSIGWRRSKRLGIAYEKGNYRTYRKQRKEDGSIPDKISSAMDLFNNMIGIEIGKITDLENIKLMVIESVLTGKCRIIKRDENGNYLDCAGSILSKESLKGKWENDKCLVWSND
jgi:hypothetical protein